VFLKVGTRGAVNDGLFVGPVFVNPEWWVGWLGLPDDKGNPGVHHLRFSRALAY
jgi:hypothetical protein